MSKATADVAPIRSATIGAAPGVWYGWVTVATMTVLICEAVRPADRSASFAAADAMSTTVSSGAAKRRVMMPERSRIHWSEESMCSQISSLVTTRSGIITRRFAAPDETVVDMASAAANEALRSAGLTASQISTVIVATVTHPY